MAQIQFKQDTAPGTPPTDYNTIYVKTDKELYMKDDLGVETQISNAGGAGEPANQIVYGTGASVDSDADFTYAGASGAFYVNTTDGSTPSVSSATPGDIALVGVTSTSLDVANAGGSGGFVRITSGDATYVAGGSIEITTPRGGNLGDGAGGEIYITGGDTADNITTAFPITDVDDTGEVFTIAGDYTEIFGTGMSFIVTGSTGNDGTYTVDSSTFTLGNTEITVNEDITDPTADGSIATVLIAANTGSNVYLRAGHFNADYVSGSGTAGNMVIAAGSAYNNDNGGANPGTVTIIGGGAAGDNNSISGGSVNITGGSTADSTSSGVNGSNVNITGGNLSDTTSGGGNAGNVVISGGWLSSTGPGTAGSVIIQGGTATALGHGGSVEITGRDGFGANRDGGDVTITAGSKTGAGIDGIIELVIPATGDLRINGDAGTAGQTLTSAGPGAPPTWAAGGGGVSEPANQIVYGTGASVDSDADFTYVPSTGRFRVNTPDGSASLDGGATPGNIALFSAFASSGNTAGGSMYVLSGYGNNGGNGGQIDIETGYCNNTSTSPAGQGGDFSIYTGSGGSVTTTDANAQPGRTGSIDIYGGEAGNATVNADSGPFDALAPTGVGDIAIGGGPGGFAYVTGTTGDGDATASRGANVLIETGTGGDADVDNDGDATAGNGGDIILQTAAGGSASVGGTGTATNGKPGNIISKSDSGGYCAQMSGYFTDEGDSTTRTYVLRGETAGGPQTIELFRNGTGTPSLRITVPTTADNIAWNFEARVVGRSQTSDEAAGYILEGVLDYDGSAVSIIGSVQKTILAESDTSWDANATADNTNKALAISVTGSATETVRWTAFVRIVAVGDLAGGGE